jgi:hypothetical protein
MSKLLNSRPNENTLDSWVGYTVNPDDAGALSSFVEGLGPGALLKPVGSYPGRGKRRCSIWAVMSPSG